MGAPNIQRAFKPTPDPEERKKIRGANTTSDPTTGMSYKESTPVIDKSENKYNVKRYMYPYDLDSNPEYGSQSAVFFINVRTAGKSVTGSEQQLYNIPDEDVSKFAGQRLANAAGDGIVQAANSVGINLNGLNPAKMMRLDTAICLHMPNSVRTNYGVNWGEASDEEMRNKDFVVQSIIKTVNSTTAGASSQSGMAAKILGGMTGAGGAAVDVAGTYAGNAIVQNMGNYAQKSFGVTGGNSKAEQVFQGVQFREFTFSYNFFPKSVEEAENILNIIRLFRYHMLPEFLDEMSFMYIYPSEFNIKYYSKGKENAYLEKLSTCVLKSLDVDYTPSGQFSTFAPTDNGAMPTQINVTMTFQELSKPSKETSPWEGPGL